MDGWSVFTSTLILSLIPNEPLEPSGAVEEALELRDEEGFITRSGIEGLVADTSQLEEDKHPPEIMLVLRTPKQQTWLASAKKEIFFLLDDESTRRDRRIIQIRQSLEASVPVGTQDHSKDLGLFKLGASDWWWYSAGLLGSPETARLRLERFIKTADTCG